MAYDIIGDIHGEADKLHALLATLGYRLQAGSYRHPNPSRTAVFVGDFIDRGPRQVETVDTVRRMVDEGKALAVMGNHEFNAIAWHTPDPEMPGEFLRPHEGLLGQKNRQQHGAFLKEVEHRPELHRELVDWFLTLPLWLDLPSIRVVHACWHQGYMEELRSRLTLDLQLTRETMVPASRRDAVEFRTVEGLTKGLEVPLRDELAFLDKDGHSRNNVRIRWWDADSTTYRELAMMPDPERLRLPDVPLEHDARPRLDSAKPVFFGHYWLTGEPVLQTRFAACVDYSAGKGGSLVAYRWDGEPELLLGNFVTA